LIFGLRFLIGKWLLLTISFRQLGCSWFDLVGFGWISRVWHRIRAGKKANDPSSQRTVRMLAQMKIVATFP
jgi:hypothetical protein